MTWLLNVGGGFEFKEKNIDQQFRQVRLVKDKLKDTMAALSIVKSLFPALSPTLRKLAHVLLRGNRSDRGSHVVSHNFFFPFLL